MTFKISEKEIRSIITGLVSDEDWDEPELRKKLESVLAWLETMPDNERYVYLLGRTPS